MGKFTTGSSISDAVMRIGLPSGYTVLDGLSASTVVGKRYANAIAAAGYDFSVLATSGVNWLNIGESSTNNGLSNLSSGTGSTYVLANQPESVFATVPVNELSVNAYYGSEQVEYASNSSTTDAADSSSFVYGPQGSTGILQTTALTTARTKTVQFQTPIKPTDTLIFEYKYANGTSWIPVIGKFSLIGVQQFETQNTSSYGVSVQHTSNAYQAAVVFGQYCYANGATFGASGASWLTGLTSGDRWRVKKVSSPGLAGFNVATTSQPVGLYQAGAAPGSTTGVAIASGYVGETVSVTPSAATATGYNAYATIGTLNLTTGVWLITATCSAAHGARPTGAGIVSISFDIYNNTDATVLVNQRYLSYLSAVERGIESAYAGGSLATTFNATSAKTILLRVKCDEANAGTGSPEVSGRAYGKFQAVRIA
jgi:hypothetical protein